MGLPGGQLITVPVPVGSEWLAEEAQVIIDQAIADAQQRGIIGKAVTPFLLDRVNQLSAGRSKDANIALLINNARVAAEIASALVR
jgi:pseudouridine-5'-phosphate glycosidase